jgi:hypothetical protein
MDQTTEALANVKTPKIVKSHPFPIAKITGAATIAPTAENMFLTRLLSYAQYVNTNAAWQQGNRLTATPDELLLGINSVSMVVAREKRIIEPTPKKKSAII